MNEEREKHCELPRRCTAHEWRGHRIAKEKQGTGISLSWKYQFIFSRLYRKSNFLFNLKRKMLFLYTRANETRRTHTKFCYFFLATFCCCWWLARCAPPLVFAGVLVPAVSADCGRRLLLVLSPRRPTNSRVCFLFAIVLDVVSFFGLVVLHAASENAHVVAAADIWLCVCAVVVFANASRRATCAQTKPKLRRFWNRFGNEMDIITYTFDIV